MTAVISFLIIMMLSGLITRMVATSLTYTGMSRESAGFQAISAFTGAGFTTSESEAVVNHPVRRRIIIVAMRLGSIGIVTIISTLVLTFVQSGSDSSLLLRIVTILIGLTLMWVAARSPLVDRQLSRFINWAIERYTDLDVPDYASLLNLADSYRIVELTVEEGDWLTGHTIGELRLSREGVLILGIYRQNGEFIGTPVGETFIRAEDVLVLYGRSHHLIELSQRRDGPFGDLAHVEAILEQQERVEEHVQEEITHRHLQAVQ